MLLFLWSVETTPISLAFNHAAVTWDNDMSLITPLKVTQASRTAGHQQRSKQSTYPLCFSAFRGKQHRVTLFCFCKTKLLNSLFFFSFVSFCMHTSHSRNRCSLTGWHQGCPFLQKTSRVSFSARDLQSDSHITWAAQCTCLQGVIPPLLYLRELSQDDSFPYTHIGSHTRTRGVFNKTSAEDCKS